MGANNTDIRIAADQIKHTVTMRQICDMYGVKVNRNNKALCPCHADTNASMHIYSGSRGWYCFSCGKGGSVIDYVMAAFGCDFQSAVRKINQDFGLGLDLDGGVREDPEAKRRIEKRKAEQDRKQRRLLKAQKDYDDALTEYVRIEKILRGQRPKNVDDMSPEWTEALKGFADADYRLRLAYIALAEAERDSS